MIDYLVKEYDVPNKTAKLYIDDELVVAFDYHPQHPKKNVFDQYASGSELVHIEDFNKIPSVGMIFNGSDFTEGENGESYVLTDKENGFPLEQGAEAIVSVFENKVNGLLILLLNNLGNPVEPYISLFAALMSNPTIVIEDKEQDPILLNQVGSTVNMLEYPDDFHHLAI
jgi:hypothetical protein